MGRPFNRMGWLFSRMGWSHSHTEWPFTNTGRAFSHMVQPYGVAVQPWSRRDAARLSRRQRPAPRKRSQRTWAGGRTTHTGAEGVCGQRRRDEDGRRRSGCAPRTPFPRFLCANAGGRRGVPGVARCLNPVNCHPPNQTLARWLSRRRTRKTWRSTPSRLQRC